MSASVLIGVLVLTSGAASMDGSGKAGSGLVEGRDIEAEQEAQDVFLADEAARSEPLALVEAGFSPGYYFRDDGVAIVRSFVGSDGAIHRLAAELRNTVIIEESFYSADVFAALASAAGNLRVNGRQSVGSFYDAAADIYVFEGNLDPDELAVQLGDSRYDYRFLPDDPPVRFSGTRTADSTPHFGGARINSNCSTGFTVKFNDSDRRILTAGHCVGMGATAYSGTKYVGTVSHRLPFPQYDAAWLAGSSYTGMIYGGGASGDAMLVGGTAANPGMGGNYCASGAFGYEHCGMGVKSFSGSLCDSAGCTNNLVTTNNTGVIPGDSGGPFYGKPATIALARGIVTGGNSTTAYYTSWGVLKSYYTKLEIIPG